MHVLFLHGCIACLHHKYMYLHHCNLHVYDLLIYLLVYDGMIHLCRVHAEIC